MNFDSYKDKGLTGLSNLGNTCFLNSTLQCLSHTYELNNMLNSKNYKNRINKTPESLILVEWDKLRELMWSENCVIAPNGFLQAVQKVARIKDKDIFTGFAQNDLPEFLDFMIDCFHNSIKREVKMNITGNVITDTDKLAQASYKMMQNMYKKEYSEFLKLFYGIHISEINSLESDYINITPEPFFNLTLPINPQNKTITGSFDLYTSVETLENDECLFIEKTNKKEKCEKKIQFWSLPDILVVTLKRFNVTPRTILKNQEFIDFELENLDLTKYVIGYDKDKYIYNLYGICNHSGGPQGGHYTAFVKNANNSWYHFNDTTISKMNNLDKLKSSKAYCFFYRKIK